MSPKAQLWSRNVTDLWSSFVEEVGCSIISFSLASEISCRGDIYYIIKQQLKFSQ